MSQPSSAVADNDGVQPLEYEVLYYERKNKVHKSKGVSKFDGILTIVFATGSIRLRSSDHNDDDASSSSSEDDESHRGGKKSFAKKKNKKKQTQKSKAVPYCGTDKALVQRCPFPDDEIIILGQYEVQIVSSLSTKVRGGGCGHSSSMAMTMTKNSATTTKATVGRNPLQSSSRTATTMLQKKRPNPAGGLLHGGATTTVKRKMVSKPLQSLSTGKRPVAIHSHDDNNANLNASGVASVQSMPQDRARPSSNQHQQLQQQPLSLRKTAAAPLHSRRGPLQSRRSAGLSSTTNSKGNIRQPLLNSSNTMTTTTRPSLHPKPQGLQKKATTSIASNNAASNNHNTNNFCPNISMPASIRSVLRPHQVQGVEFLWNALTVGSNRGAILADEMVIVLAELRSQVSHDRSIQLMLFSII